MRLFISAALIIAMALPVFADEASESRVRVAMAMVRVQAQAAPSEPAPFKPVIRILADSYSTAVEWSRTTGRPVLVFVDRENPPLDDYATFRIKPIGWLKSGQVWKCWWADGRLVGEPYTIRGEWQDDAGHRHVPLPGDHRHVCNVCGESWFHGSENYGNAASHRCPIAGCRGQDWDAKPVRRALPVSFLDCPLGRP